MPVDDIRPTPDPSPITQERRVHINRQIRYEAPPEAVYAMLTDEGFQNRKLAGSGALTHTVAVRPAGDGGASVRTSRELPTDRVPDAFRTLVGASLTVVQEETWEAPDSNGSRTGRLSVEVTGTPVRLAGTLRLVGDGRGGTLETVDGELRAKVPLIGGRIEKAVEPVLSAAIASEERVGREWLSAT